MLSPEELIHGYWGAREHAGLQPDVVKECSEYNDTSTLSLACTQLSNRPASEQKKIVKEWCEALPHLNIRVLAFYSRINQELFDAATRIQGLEALFIKWGSIKSLESITDCPNLVSLHIGSNPSLTGLSCLHRLPRIRHLTIENTHEPQDLGFVRDMKTLEEFAITGTVSSFAKQPINDLWPLQELENLEFLQLTGIKIMKDGFLPLYTLPRLTTFYCAYTYRLSEFTALRQAVPSLKYGSLFDEAEIAKFSTK